MKKLIILAIILVLFALLFEKINIFVEGGGGPLPSTLVRLGNNEKFTDNTGKAELLKTIFQNTVELKRLGFSDKTVTLPFSLLRLSYNVVLEPVDYDTLNSQLNKMLTSFYSYEYNYELKVDSSGKTQTQTITAKFDKGNFYFSNKSDFTGADYTVIYKNKNFYLMKDEKEVPLQGEDKDNFVSENIVFLSASDIVSSILPDEKPDSISYQGNEIVLNWKNAQAILTVGNRGLLSELDFTHKTNTQSVEVRFSLDKINSNPGI